MGACRKPPKNVMQLTKSPLKHYLKTVYRMISKSEFFCCHTDEFDFSGNVVEGWERGLHAPRMGVFLAYVLH